MNIKHLTQTVECIILGMLSSQLVWEYSFALRYFVLINQNRGLFSFWQDI